MILLSPEELKQAQESVGWFCTDNDYYGYSNGLNAIAKAQLKQVVKWLEEDCPHDVTPQIPYARAKRKHCVECWQDLKKEASLDT